MDNKKRRIISIVLICFVFLDVCFLVAFAIRNYREDKYIQADSYFNSGQYSKAEKLYSKLGKYKDSKKLLKKTNKYRKKKEVYNIALKEYEYGHYQKALDALNNISDFEDSEKKIKEIKYSWAEELYEKGDYYKARIYFQEINIYEDSDYYLSKIDLITSKEAKLSAYKKAKALYADERYEKALDLFKELGKYKKSKKYVEKCNENIKRSDLNNVIAAGVRNSVAVTEDGKVLVAGTNVNHQKEVDKFEDIISVDAYGYFVACLTEKGKVVFSGKKEKEQPNVSKWKRIKDIAVGENFIVGLDEDGKVWADGHKASGQLKVKKWRKVMAIDAGWSFTVALTEDKELLFAGADNGQRNEFEDKKEQWKKVINISASGGGPHEKQRGAGHTVGLCSDGTVVAIGDKSRGQCDVSDWKDIIKIDTGDWYTVGVDKYGKVHITGENFPGSYYINENVLKDCTDIVDVAAGFGQTLCLHKNGTVTAFGFPDENKISDIDDWTEKIRVD